MRNVMMFVTAAVLAIACNSNATSPVSADAKVAKKKLYLDVHDLGPGKVTALAVADAHAKDLAVEGKYGADYKAYWVDEKAGKIYCLVEAPSADAAIATHKEAHGLLASNVMEVTPYAASWTPSRDANANAKLYLDVHHVGPGKVTVADVAAAHEKDLAVQAKYGVKYLNYWVDPESGTIVCLSEAPNADASIAVHKEAHGLIPESIAPVSEGR